MEFCESFNTKIFNINDQSFETYALELFSYQRKTNQTYQTYIRHLKGTSFEAKSINEIPFLPIDFWKSHVIKSGSWKDEKIFKSSGTGTGGRSSSHVRTLENYYSITTKGFEQRFGQLKDFEILALLPSYQEQGQSSLIAMVDDFMNNAKPASKYYQVGDIAEIEKRLTSKNGKKLLIGVSYALLDLIETASIATMETIIMETGGMKGRKKELVRADLHALLKKGFETDIIYSEYGMSELSSQAYTDHTMRFVPPDWMKIMVRDINDPLSFVVNGNTGGLNIIDLANINTCAFIETQDLGKLASNGTFEVLGRFDNADIRGCNLLSA
ncbi:MAG: hypothetical protein ACJAZM_000412 [Cyclobacteriaceae bacterium]|jgi:hypothetical protein